MNEDRNRGGVSGPLVGYLAAVIALLILLLA